MHRILLEEKQRQIRSLNLIASENYASKAVLQALGACVHNKTSEGMVGNRYYGSCVNIDKVEQLCKDRALAAYRLDPSIWGVNVQTLSGSMANLSVYKGLLKPGGRIMGLYLSDGGHLTHGYSSGKRRLTASSEFYESMSYRTDPNTGLIDYDKLHEWASGFEPRLIIAGISCYPRHLDYKRFRDIADDVGAYLLGDIAHISGLVAAGIGPDPFKYCDVVTTTTYKSLRGPRTAMVLYRKALATEQTSGEVKIFNLEKRINEAVFPGTHGAPHNHAIASLAVALKEVVSDDYRAYQRQAVANCKILATCLQTLGYHIVTGGITDMNMLLANLKNKGITGKMAQTILEHVGIDVNMNTCPGDISPLRPSGVRLGTSAITSRGLKEKDIENCVILLNRGIGIAQKAKKIGQERSIPFITVLRNVSEIAAEISNLKSEVEDFAEGYPMPGIDGCSIKI
ncbi:serine hydroxymethyltransferase, cytosolic-like isoform X2 [Lineus longissimus]